MEANQFLVSTIFALAAIIFIKWLINFIWKCRVMPGGPWGLPLVGYSPWLGKLPHETFAGLVKKYGGMFSVSVGSETVVVLNDWESVKACLVDQPKVFSGRPPLYLMRSMTGRKDVIFNDGPVWKAQRNLTVQILKQVGVGKSTIQAEVMEMVHEVMDKLDQLDGRVQLMEDIFTMPALKLLWKLLAGEEAESCGPLLNEFDKLIKTFLDMLVLYNNQVLNRSSWLRFLPPNGSGHWQFLRYNRVFEKLLKKTVDQHRAQLDENNLDNFIDRYLTKINSSQSAEAPFNTESLVFTLWSLLMAGMDTTLNSCQWTSLLLAYHPEVQKKAQAEIDEQVGRHRLPTLDDLPKFQYLNAVIMEVHRKSSMVAMAVPHRALETTKVLGHTIPKDTIVVQNIYAVHHDPKLWDQPEVFKPERFLDANNKAKAPPYFMPFSLGPRVCLGQPLAEMELRLLFSCLLQRYSFHLPPEGPPPSLIGNLGINYNPPPFSLLIRKRKD